MSISKGKIIISEIEGLAEEIGFFFDTPKIINYFSDKVAADYGLDGETVADFVYEIALENFNFDDFEQRLVKELNLSETIVTNLSVDILGKVFLPLDRFIAGKPITAELAKRKINPEGFSAYIERFNLFLEEERDKNIKELENFYERTINSPEEKREILNLFANDLADILSGGTPEALAGLNDVLLYLLDSDRNFSQELAKAVLGNNQILTKNPLQLDGRQVEPTITNWLKAFIGQRGTAIFSTLDLSNFLISSPNTRQLSDKEREIIVKLLTVYRNIKFYPVSLADVPVEELMIIPFEKPVIEKKSIKKEKGAEESTVEQKLAKHDWSKITGIERRALLEELGVSLKDFAKWSGERK